MHYTTFSRTGSALFFSSFLLLSACGGGGSTPPATDDTTGTPSAITQAEVAGRAYLGADGMLVIDAGGNATAYRAEGMTAFTWAVDGNTLTLASANGTLTFTVSADNTTLTGHSTYHLSQPLTLAALNGLHLTETIDTTNDDCTARTLSFTDTTLTVREVCGSDYSTFDLSLTGVDGVANLLRAYGMEDGETVDVYIALSAGELAGELTLLFTTLISGVADGQASGKFTRVSELLEPPPVIEPIPEPVLPTYPTDPVVLLPDNATLQAALTGVEGLIYPLDRLETEASYTRTAAQLLDVAQITLLLEGAGFPVASVAITQVDFYDVFAPGVLSETATATVNADGSVTLANTGNDTDVSLLYPAYTLQVTTTGETRTLRLRTQAVTLWVSEDVVATDDEPSGGATGGGSGGQD